MIPESVFPEYQPPAEREVPGFYRGYVQRVQANSESITQILALQLREFLQALQELPEQRWGYRYAPGKWSVKQVLGHLIDCERVFAYRAMCIARGEQKPLPGFDQDAYVDTGEADQRSPASLLDEYEAVRKASIQLFQHLPELAWTRMGNANEHPVSVRAIAWIIAGHERHHLEIFRTHYQLF
jgi:uncharacterized damage-inducible protein DinB